MTFNSLIFALFMILTTIIYFCVKKNQWIVLLVVSLAFYITWGVEKLPFVLVSSLIAWLAGRAIGRKYEESDRFVKELETEQKRIEKNKEISDGITSDVSVDKGDRDNKQLIDAVDHKKCISDAKKKSRNYARRITVVTVILMLLLLIYVKVGKLLVEAFAAGSDISIIVPLGISYYTFSLIGYVLDCYWRKETYEKNYFKLLLFAVYFPKIVQGPISKHRTLAGQLLADHKYDYKNLCYGAQLMMWGYFKKLVIADRLAIFVNSVYGDYVHKSGSMLLVASIFGAFQLYCDFSGCMDIACGFSEIIGINLEKNFNHPFFSESASEFWRRWHITLGVWFKDYVYMPISTAPWMMKLMGKIRKRFGMGAAKNVGTIIALAVVWLLTGLWHGTGLNYIVWGAYWGILIIASLLLTPLFIRITKRLNINQDSAEWHSFRRFRTFILFVISRIITLPGDFAKTVEVFKRIINKFYPWELVDGTIFNMGLNRPNLAVAVLCLVLLYFVSRYEENGGKVRDYIASRQIVARWIILYALMFSIVIFGIYGPGYDASSFVYMQY